MTVSTQSTPQRHLPEIDAALRSTIQKIASSTNVSAHSETFYGQMQYHLGWVDANLQPVRSHPGKLLRPMLVLLAYEAAGAWGLAHEDFPTNKAYLQRALPAAVSVELTHNFTLIHDDIEDGDTERRYRSTVWKLWGVPQAINAGDGLYSLARLALWEVLERGVDGSLAARLGQILDHTCLTIAEGQYLDMSFESRQDISVAMYKEMITRKTAALMECAALMGALLGTTDQETITRLSGFGRAIGLAFQIRDDLLGVWATTAELGKTPAGDIYRRKKTLPLLHALEQANASDQRTLHTFYEQEAALSPQQVEEVLAIFARTKTRPYCLDYLAQQCQLAHVALANVSPAGSPLSQRALKDLETIVRFVEGTGK